MIPSQLITFSPATGRLVALPAVRAACQRALAARERRLQEYPHWQAWRRQAREIKAEAVARLEELLGRLPSGLPLAPQSFQPTWKAQRPSGNIGVPPVQAIIPHGTQMDSSYKFLVLGAQGPQELHLVHSQTED